MNENVITAICTALVTIAGMIFREKHKSKTTKRKTKTVDTRLQETEVIEPTIHAEEPINNN